jgi:meiotically up-regulated gene 157 (Mug157) protein
MNRRTFMKNIVLATPALGVAERNGLAVGVEVQGAPDPVAAGRPAPRDRKFTSDAVEQKTAQVAKLIAKPKLRELFENCYPNTLDTTVSFDDVPGAPDTFPITGDIPAMWLRDSTCQVTPYLPLAKSDPKLMRMFSGLIKRQAKCILLDPYANAFYKTPVLGDFKTDDTQMTPGVHERKWEIDSLCYPIRLAYLYWKTTGDKTPFTQDWQKAAKLIVETFTVQQRLGGEGPYRFGRSTTSFYDNAPNHGLGAPTRKIGLIHSAFRPSDDSCMYPFLVPSNIFARRSLVQLAELSTSVLGDAALAASASHLAVKLQEALQRYAITNHTTHGEILPYEIDGLGNVICMDDANAPGLLSLPYLDCCAPNDPLYLRTRKFVLSSDNPYFFTGQFAEGIGGPHVGPNMVWPLSIIIRALTSSDDAEILQSLRTLIATDAGTGFMHESFDPNNPQKFTRPWFAWCNSLFGELVVRVAKTKPELLKQV